MIAIPIVSQEYKVRSDIISIYDRVLLVYMKIHVVPPPPPPYHFYTPNIPGLVFVLKTTVI